MDDLAPLKALIRERDSFHKEKMDAIVRKNSLLESEINLNRRKLYAYENREVAFKQSKEEFRQDVKELERASMLLSQKEREVESRGEDLERIRRKYEAQIRSLQDELDSKSTTLTNIIEEYKRYRETVAQDTVSRKSFDDLTREYENRVPKEAYDRMTIKVSELQRRIDHDFTPNENVEELRNKLKRLETNIDNHYVANHIYQRATETLKAVQNSVTVLEESRNSAQDELRKSEIRISGLKSELDDTQSVLKETSLKLGEIEISAEQLKIDRDKLREEAMINTQTMLESETEKNMLHTQVGSLKATSKRDAESRIASETQYVYMKEAFEKSQRRVRELEGAEAERDRCIQECEAWRNRVQGLIKSVETEAVRSQSIAAENEVLAQSYLDLSARHSMLELQSSVGNTLKSGFMSSTDGYSNTSNMALSPGSTSGLIGLDGETIDEGTLGTVSIGELGGERGIYLPPSSEGITAQADNTLMERLNHLEKRFLQVSASAS